MNEIIASYFDHNYVRRDGILYDEWMCFGEVCQSRIKDDEIPQGAFRHNPPIVYRSDSTR